MQDNFSIHSWRINQTIKEMEEEFPDLSGDGKITQKDILIGKGVIKKEGEDHEVSMAQNSLQSIISSASQLMNKLGNDERDIPGWIQDHITNAENYIDQAAQGFHELEPTVNDLDADNLDMVAENVSENKKKKAKNALTVHLKTAIKNNDEESVEEIKKAKDRIDNAESIDILIDVLGEFGFDSDEIGNILGK